MNHPISQAIAMIPDFWLHTKRELCIWLLLHDSVRVAAVPSLSI